MMKFEIKNRWTGSTQFTAEIDCPEDAAIDIKVGLAVKWGVKNGASLVRANLDGASLVGASHIADRVIDGGIRSDGYRFLLTRTEPGEFRIKAGCRNFTVTEAKAHWNERRPKGEPLGDETRLIIKHMLAMARLRNWKPLAEPVEAPAEAAE